MNLIAHRSEVSKHGDYVNLPVGVSAYRSADSVSVWNGLCPHRGTRLFKDPLGHERLECPYHGWSEKLILAGIEEERQTWAGDWLFSGDAVVEDLGSLFPLLSVLSSRIAHPHGFTRFNIACDWKVAVENALEDVHVPHVHPESIGKLGLECEGMEQYGRNSIAYYRITDRRTLDGIKTVAQHVEFCEPSKYFHILIYPWTCISSVGGLSYTVTQYFPSAHGTTLWSRLYAPRVNSGAPSLDFFYDSAEKFNRQVFQEDALICERVGGQGTILMDAEKRVKWFREVA